MRNQCLIPTLLVLFSALIVNGQYDGQSMANGYRGGGGYANGDGYGNGGGGGSYGGEYGDGGDGRPKVHLGLRVKIPAIKFDLPRFSLPKITVSAKIRQPNKPRTITLPEINLDTSSKVSQPDKGGDSSGGYYGNQGGYSAPQSYSSGYGNSDYGGDEKTSSFSFSTSEEESGGGGYNKPGMYPNQGPRYSSTNAQPTYSVADQVEHSSIPVGQYSRNIETQQQSNQYNNQNLGHGYPNRSPEFRPFEQGYRSQEFQARFPSHQVKNFANLERPGENNNQVVDGPGPNLYAGDQRGWQRRF